MELIHICTVQVGQCLCVCHGHEYQTPYNTPLHA